MAGDMQTLYAERMARYVTAMRNEKPDRIPIRPFVAEFTAVHAGYTCQEVTHDYTKAFDAVCRCALDYDWDAMVANMVYVWTGLTEAIGLRYYGVPGIHVPADVGFQYREPPHGESFMDADEYGALIKDPTGFLFNTWLPRVSRDVVAPGAPATFRHNLSFLKGGMAMMQYFTGFGPQIGRMKYECGMPSAIAGILKAPLDIIADKLRGYLGLLDDLRERPDRVRAACEALAPHLAHVALSGADPAREVPISIWMHRGCVPFVSPEVFDTIYWPTLKPIIETIWAAGHQTLFYAEGSWDHHLETFAELPPGCIIYHVDQGDIFKAHRILGDRFCISGGIPNHVLSFGTPQEVRDCCKKVIDGVAADGGYIVDAGAILQNDTKIENMRAMTEFVREYGVYPGGESRLDPDWPPIQDGPNLPATSRTKRKPGVCVPYEEKRAEWPTEIAGEALARRVWEEVDALGYVYIWHCLLSF